jgi:acetolactate synthase-1/2/3 large subunit
MNYADQLCGWLHEYGFKRCYYVAGGHSMYLLKAASTRFECVPVVHEVAAGIAADYATESGVMSFALITSGPGVTNAMTAMATAHLDSRFVLVLAGQVKSTDLSHGKTRQKGIQEIDTKSLVSGVASSVLTLDRPASREQINIALDHASTRRAGACFIDVCLDVQNLQANPALDVKSRLFNREQHFHNNPFDLLAESKRPLVLIGSEVKRHSLIPRLCEHAQIPIATTWTAADRVHWDSPVYAGRPNHYGMRWANLAIQQADAIFAIGTRLNVQTMGLNVESFAPNARIFLNYSDYDEILAHPKRLWGFSTMNPEAVAQQFLGVPTRKEWGEWAKYVRKLKLLCDPTPQRGKTGLNPYRFIKDLSNVSRAGDLISVGSSGNGYTMFMQAFEQRGQTIVNSPAMASMGVGLAGAIGLASSHPNRRTILYEGDGSFTQNLQELGTVARQNLNLKMFILDNNGYQSIRTTHERFLGKPMGCDIDTGLGIPDWVKLFDAYDIGAFRLPSQDWHDLASVQEAMESKEPFAFIVPIDSEIGLREKVATLVDGDKITSAPIHDMQPELPDAIKSQVNLYLR